MNRTFDAPKGSERDEVAALTTDIRVRVLNVSAAGCLIETRRALDIGSVATLRISLAGGDFEDTVQIVRCQEITGAGAYELKNGEVLRSPSGQTGGSTRIRRRNGFEAADGLRHARSVPGATHQ